MICQIFLWSFVVLVITENAYCMKLENRLDLSDRSNDDIDVEFLIWNPEQKCTWSWVTWSCVSHPASIRFNSGVEAQFDALPANHFKKNGKTIIVIHGWTENGRNDWNRRMKDEFFKRDPVPNVITVEWSELAKGPDYDPAARNTQRVGQHVANFVNYLINRSDTMFSLEDFHIIGFSLGAQVAGSAGKTLGGKLPRITGLDPAGPGFEDKGKGERLDKSDAKFVDVIHTLQNNGKPLGHLDFWPNGGKDPMPGCHWWGMYSVACSHMKAVEYYIESINSRVGFPATKCDNYQKFKELKCDGNSQKMMGDPLPLLLPTSQEGNYYLYTNAWSPFARG